MKAKRMTSTDTAVISPVSATEWFIAVPGDDQASAIFGIGETYEGAVRDAYAQSNTHEPSVTRGEDGQWVVATGYGEDATFAPSQESEARDYAAQKGCIARPCTERLFLHIKAHGCDANFRWTMNAVGLDDLEFEQDEFDAAVAEVEEGLEGNTSQDTWKAEEALDDAAAYVDAYVVDDENVDEALRDVLKPGTSLRTAVNVAVRDILLEQISELASA